MIRKIFFALLIPAAICLYGKSEGPAANEFFNTIGIRGSNISGSGISYSRMFTENFSFGIQGIAFYDEYIRGQKNDVGGTEDEDSNIFYNYGVELRRDFYRTDAARVYALAGIYKMYERRKNSYNTGDYETGNYRLSITEDMKSDAVGGGLGLGVEFVFRKRFTFNVDFGYKYEGSEGWEWNYNHDKKTPYSSKTTTLGMGVGLSFHY